MKLTTLAKKMLDGLLDAPLGMGPDGNPFVREGDRVYARYDKLEIKNANDGLGGTLCAFSWHGTIYYWMRIDGPPCIAGDMILTLAGVEGRQEVKLTTS